MKKNERMNDSVMDGLRSRTQAKVVKVICVFLWLAMLAGAQLVVPDNGWQLLEKGDGKAEGERFLGVWENEEKTILVGVAWAPELPEFGVFLGFGSGNKGVDPSDWPQNAEVLKEGRLGVRVEMRFVDVKKEEREERYWIYGENGGVWLKVLLLEESEFSLEGWGAKGEPVDPEGDKRKEMENVVTRVKAAGIPRTIEMDPRKSEEEITKTLKRFEVEIREGGEFWFQGKKVKETDLREVLKGAAMTVKKTERESVIQLALDIVAEKGVEFRFVQRLVEIGKQAGIQLASIRQIGAEERE